MPFQVDAVTLPIDPTTTEIRIAAFVKEIGLPGSSALLISLGSRADIMTWEGTIAEMGKSASQLETDYVIPLKNKVHTQVTVAAPGTLYDGNWILSRADFKQHSGVYAAFSFRMEFMKGSTHIVL